MKKENEKTHTLLVTNDNILFYDVNLFSFNGINPTKNIDKNEFVLKLINNNTNIKIIAVKDNEEFQYEFEKEENCYINYSELKENDLISVKYKVYKENSICVFFLHKLPSNSYFEISKVEKIIPIKNTVQTLEVYRSFEQIKIDNFKELINYDDFSQDKYEKEVYEFHFDFNKKQVKQFLIEDNFKELYYEFYIWNSKSLASPLYDFWIELEP